MKARIPNFLLVLVLLSGVPQAAAQGTAFMYQGRLTDGGHPANGSYDLTFMLFATNNGGVSVAGPITNTAVAVSHGLFTVALDFGEGVFTGDARWLDIAVCTNGAGAFTTLTPRQRLAPSPYALFANGASNAVNAATADVANSANSVSATNITGTLPNGVLPASPTFIGTVTAGAFSGNGGGMTNLDAGNLTGGTVPDALLSTNVALLTSCGISVVLTTNVLPDPMHPNTNVAYVTGGMSVGVSNGVYVWSEDIGALTNHGVGLTLSPETQMWVFTNATFPDPSWTGRNFAAIDMDGNMAASDEWYSNDVETVIIGMSASFGTNYLTLVRTNVTYGSNVVGSFQGSGAQLTGIPLSGLQARPLTNRQAGVTLSGTFNGDGTGLTNVNVPNSVTNGQGFYQGGSPLILDMQASGATLTGQLWPAMPKPWKIIYCGNPYPGTTSKNYLSETNILWIINDLITNGTNSYMAALTNDGSQVALFLEYAWDGFRNTNWSWVERNLGTLTWDTNRFPSGLPYLCSVAHSNNIKMLLMRYYATNITPATANSWICTDGGHSLQLWTNGVGDYPSNSGVHYVTVTTPDCAQYDMQELSFWGFDGIVAANCQNFDYDQGPYMLGRALLQMALPHMWSQLRGTISYQTVTNIGSDWYPFQWDIPYPTTFTLGRPLPPVLILGETLAGQNAHSMGYLVGANCTGVFYDNNGQGTGAAGLRNIYRDFPVTRANQGAMVVWWGMIDDGSVIAQALSHGVAVDGWRNDPLWGGDWSQWLRFATNAQWSAINQDPGQLQPRLKDYGTNVGSVWFTELSSGNWAVGIFNEGSTPNTFTVNWADLFWPTNLYVHVREILPDVKDWGTNLVSFATNMPAGSSALFEFDEVAPLQPGGTLSGNGSALTGLNAASLASGTVPDARLSTNVALLNQSGISQSFTTNVVDDTNLVYVTGGMSVGLSNGVYVWSADIGAYTNQGSAMLADLDDSGLWLFTNALYPDALFTDLNFAALDMDGGGSISPADGWVTNDLSMNIPGMTVGWGTNYVVTPSGIANFKGSFTGNGNGLTNLDIVASGGLTNIANGVYLAHNNQNYFCGTNGAAFKSAVANANIGDTIFLGPGRYNLGVSGYSVTKAVNIEGAGSGVFDYSSRTFSGGTIFTPSLGYFPSCTNVTWENFAVEHPDSIIGFVGSLTSTNYSGMRFNDIAVGCTGTNFTSSEGAYISGTDIEINHLRIYCEPVHGFVIKGVSNLVVNLVEIHDRPSCSKPFDSVIIKATWIHGNGDVKNVKIRGLLIDQCHGSTDLQIQDNDTGVVQDLDIDDATIMGTVAPAPVWIQATYPTGAWNRVTFSNFRVSGTNYTHLWEFYQPDSGQPHPTFTNTTFANWVCDVPNMTTPLVLYSSVSNNGTYYFNNILANGVLYSGVDNSVCWTMMFSNGNWNFTGSGTVTAAAFAGNGSGLTSVGSALAVSLTNFQAQFLAMLPITIDDTNRAYVGQSVALATVGISNGWYVWSPDIGALTNHGCGLVYDDVCQAWLFTNAAYPDPFWLDGNYAACDETSFGLGTLAPSDTWVSNDNETVIAPMTVRWGAITTFQVDASGNVHWIGTASGNGAGLTNLPAAQLTGTIPGAALTGLNMTNVAASGTFNGEFNGSFTGNGAGLTNLNLPGMSLTPLLLTNNVVNTNLVYVTGGGSVGLSNGLYVWSADIGAYTNQGSAMLGDLDGSGLWLFTNALYPDAHFTDLNFAALNFSGDISGAWVSNDYSTTIVGMVANWGTNDVVTTNGYNVNFAGSFAGNGSGMTNLNGANFQPGTFNASNSVASFSVVVPNLDNTTWLALKASTLLDNQNWRHGSWTNTLTKIKKRQQFRLELDGTGLVNLGELNGAWLDITNIWPLAGYLNSALVSSTVNSGSVENKTGKDGYWYLPYNQTTNVNGTNTLAFSRFTWNVLEIDYIAETNGGSFKLQTNNGAGGAFANTDLPVVSAINSTLLGKSTWWTNHAGPQNIKFQIVSTTAGTNRIVNYAFWNSTITNGIIVGLQAMASSHVADELAISNSITWQIYSNLAPDMILWASPEYTYALPPLTNWIAFYQSACPKADIVLCGQYPLADGVQTAANQMTLNYAMQYNVAYFDGETPFENYSNWAARGFGSGDGTHGSAAGYAAYGYLLSRFLGLNCLWLP